MTARRSVALRESAGGDVPGNGAPGHCLLQAGNCENGNPGTGMDCRKPRSRRSVPAFRPTTEDDDFRWLLALLAAVVFEGALRKWVLPDALQPFAYGAKDVVALLFVLEHPLPRCSTGARDVRTAAFVVAFLLAPAFILGLSQNALAAISTYKNAVLWPIFGVHLMPRLSARLLDRLLPVMAAITCGMAVLGAVQYYSPGGAFINRYAWFGDEGLRMVSSFGRSDEGIRAAGTFGYIAGMSGFATFCFSFALWRFLLSTTRRHSLIAAVTAGAAVCCAFESGSRSPVVMLLTMLVAATLVAGRVRVALRMWTAMLALGLVVFLVLGQDIIGAFVRRSQTADDTFVGRITGEGLKANYLELIAANPLGVGLGQTTGYGAQQTLLATGTVVGYDDGGSNAVLQSGVAGLVALWVMALPLGVLVLHGLLGKSQNLRYATAILGLVSVYQVWGGIWYHHTATAFTWVSIGMWLSCLNHHGISRPSLRASDRQVALWRSWVGTRSQPSRYFTSRRG